MSTCVRHYLEVAIPTTGTKAAHRIESGTGKISFESRGLAIKAESCPCILPILHGILPVWAVSMILLDVCFRVIGLTLVSLRELIIPTGE